MNNSNLQEQNALLEEERRENKRKTIIIIILCILIILVTLLGIYFSISKKDKACTLNCDTNNDGIIDLNIDLDGDGVCDVNCDTNNDGKPDINIDYKGDRIPHFNIDTDGDGKPDVNLVNKDTDGDGKPDFNIDTDDDGYPDINIDFDNTNTCDINCDTNNDGKPDTNIDVNGDGKPDIKIDTDNDGKADENLTDQDTDNDGVCDLNCDTDNDGHPDTNIDIDGDGKPDINIDTDNDGVCDLNCDTNNDGKPDINIDNNGDGKPDTNIDTNNDGVCDVNCDTNNDGVCDNNCVGDLYSSADLSSIKVENYTLKPKFNKDTIEYTVEVAEDQKSVEIKATPLNEKATVIGTGLINLVNNSTRVSITVIAQDGTTKTYYVTINKAKNPSTSEEGSGNIDIDTSEDAILSVNFTKPMNAKNIIPGWTGSHEFTIKNNSNKTVVYNINLIKVTNTFTSNNFVYSLVKDGQTLVNETTALKKDGSIAKNIVIAPGETASFQINYEFKYLEENQDYDKGQNYSGTVEIQLVSAN